MFRAVRVSVVGIVTLLFASQAWITAQPPQTRALLEARLRSPLPSERIGALAALKQYPQTDSVRPALLIWNKDHDRDVRMVAGGVLYAWRSDARVRQAYLATLKKEVSDADALLVGAWLAGSKVEEHDELLDLLARVFEKRPTAVQLLMPVADFLGTRDDADAVKALTAFTMLKAYQKHFGFRRSVVQALIAVQRHEAVTTLVDVMLGSDGEIQGDIALYLTRISGEPYGIDAKAWKTWWGLKHGTFAFPAPAVQKARHLVGVPTYYNIPVYAKKAIFVIDTSGSMTGARLANAKVELKKTIEGFSGTTQFNIIAYSSTLQPWQRAVQPITTETQGKAKTWVDRLMANGATHTFDALRVALDQQPEAMYVLTDGKPTGGTLVEPRDILEAIAQTNKYRRTTVHVIGLDPGPDDGVFNQFLKELAGQNYGQYRRVD